MAKPGAAQAIAQRSVPQGGDAEGRRRGADPDAGDVAATGLAAPQGRPASAAPYQPLPATTWGADVSPGLGERSAGTSATLRLFQGSAESKEFKFP